MRPSAVVILALASACKPAVTATPKPATGAIVLGDATLVAPKGWTVEQTGDRVAFTDPTNNVRVWIVANAGPDPAAAIAQAWGASVPGVAKEPEESPDPGDWDAMTSVEYDSKQPRVAFGRWYSAGTHRVVVLVDADSTSFDRREADIDVLVGSVRVPGMRERTLGARRPLDGRQLDAFVERALHDLDVPGAAIAVLDDGKVVYERTLGVKQLGTTDKITPDTRFLLASITKPMTTMMEGALVDAGVVRWDSPVTSILPDFAIGDAELTRQLQLWHMSCACTGMPRQDLEDLMEWNGITPEMRLASMRAMKPTTGLGETFQYSNLMVAAGGFIAAHAYKRDVPLADAYAAAMQDKIFGPIGMGSTTVAYATVETGDHAVPHAVALDGTTRAIPLAWERGVEPIAPAGGVWTTLRDMERYVATELADGVAPDGTRVISDPNMRERLRPRVRTSGTGGYGLGVGVSLYSGTRRISHDGGSLGFGTRMLLLPDQHVGIIVFTNVRNGEGHEQLPFNDAVSRRIVELMYDGAAPLAERKLAFYSKLRTERRHALPVDPDRSWVERVAGRYHDPALGDLAITAPGILDAGEWQSAIARTPNPDGTATLTLLDPPFAGTPWRVEADGTITIPGYPGYRFTRAPTP